MQIKAYIFDQTRYCHILNRENNFVRNLLTIVATIVITGNLTAYHQFLQIILVHIRALNRVNIYTITKNCDCVRFIKNLRKVMGDKDDGVAALFDSLHMFIQFLTTFL